MIELQRTLRLPEDGRTYPLPPGLDPFPLRHVDDYADRIPARVRRRGGVLMPMYQSEAMWIEFGAGPDFADESYPCAVKIAAGKVNAVTGEGWSRTLHRQPQDYVVTTKQPWLDGFSVAKGEVRQFVAVPLGEGFSAEEQVAGTDVWGGVQLLVYPMRAEAYGRLRRRQKVYLAMECDSFLPCTAMGLAPGGKMRQKVYADPYQPEDWDQRNGARCFVSILNSKSWLALTGERPPHRPPTAEAYSAEGLPWYDYYDAEAEALEGSEALGKLKGVETRAKHVGAKGLSADRGALGTAPVHQLRDKRPETVREGKFWG